MRRLSDCLGRLRFENNEQINEHYIQKQVLIIVSLLTKNSQSVNLINISLN